MGWEPLGNDGARGEYSVAHEGEDSIFVEVKSPGWEGELGLEERLAGRTKKPKYIVGEGTGGPLHRNPQCTEEALAASFRMILWASDLLSYHCTRVVNVDAEAAGLNCSRHGTHRLR